MDIETIDISNTPRRPTTETFKQIAFRGALKWKGQTQTFYLKLDVSNATGLILATFEAITRLHRVLKHVLFWWNFISLTFVSLFLL